MSPTVNAALSTWRNLAVGALVALAIMPLGIAQASDRSGLDSRVLETVPLGSDSKGSSTALLAGSLYSNIVTNSGLFTLTGGASCNLGSCVSKVLGDDITPAGGISGSVTQILYSVVNDNDVAVSARVLLHFWSDNSGTPGAYYSSPPNVEFTVNSVSFPAKSTTFLSLGVAPGVFVVPLGTFWCGMAFDNNGGQTGATDTQLMNLGQAIFENPTDGSSDDLAFRTQSAGSFFGISDPLVDLLTPGPEKPYNFYLRFTADGITSSTKSTWSRVKQLYR